MIPLISAETYGTGVYCTDAGGGRVLEYNKTTGVFVRQITGLPLACGIAINNATATSGSGTNTTRFRALMRPALSRGRRVCRGEPRCGCFVDPGEHAGGGDERRGDQEVYDFRVKSDFGGFLRTGVPARGQGARAGARDPRDDDGRRAGNIYFTDRIGNGARFQKIDSAMDPVWQMVALENTSALTFHGDDPDFLVSGFKNIYDQTGDAGATFLGNARTESFEDLAYMGHWEVGHFGPPKLLKLNGTLFWYFFAGESVGIYRVAAPPDGERSNLLDLVGIMATGAQPQPQGTVGDPFWHGDNRYIWSWNDNQGDHQVDFVSIASPNEVTLTPIRRSSGFLRRGGSRSRAPAWTMLATSGSRRPPSSTSRPRASRPRGTSSINCRSAASTARATRSTHGRT